jgi:hypothetical protein
VFGTTCLVLSDGSSVNHDGSLCSGGVNQLVANAGYYAVNWCDMRVLIQKTVTGASAAPLAARC